MFESQPNKCTVTAAHRSNNCSYHTIRNGKKTQQNSLYLCMDYVRQKVATAQ
jgi:hypothetical protein